MNIDSMLSKMANRGSSAQRRNNYTGKIFNGWRFVTFAYSFGGHSFWNVESTSECHCKKQVDVAMRHNLKPCRCAI